MNIQNGDMQVTNNDIFLQKAESLRPKLNFRLKNPTGFVVFQKNEYALHEVSVVKQEPVEFPIHLEHTGSCVTLDFSEHIVGYPVIKLHTSGSHQDAPIRMRLVFGEMPCEIFYPIEDYNGWLSKSWLQEELVFVDVAPAEIRLPRRYSFRYVKIIMEGISPKFGVVIDGVSCRTVTSANLQSLAQPDLPEDLRKIDKVSTNTLRDCMQDVFEDGPKRDRRLWLGDLRLQALVNYVTFRNNNLVKRCLYLFAGATNSDGRISACIFTQPQIVPDNTFLFDYSLMFVTILYEYYEATGDLYTLRELWPSALWQIRLAEQRLDSVGLVRDSDDWWAFIDWGEGLNKQASVQGVFLYCVENALRAADILGAEEKEYLSDLHRRLTLAARKLWDEELGFFVSGKERQISWASQIWMILAGVTEGKAALSLLGRLREKREIPEMSSAYLYHYYIEALMKCGRNEEALRVIRSFWGGMIAEGADTFWEVYMPENKNFSPYGSVAILSYCHAWSCTPAYFLRLPLMIKSPE